MPGHPLASGMGSRTPLRLFPLPEGEGQGEGDATHSSAECHQWMRPV